MSGEAITAGSSLNLLASIGRKLPISLAIIIVPTSVSDTTRAIKSPLSTPLKSNIINFAKFAAARVIPQRIETLTSFHKTLMAFEKETSPSDNARITDTEACEPALPPVPVIIGINAESTIAPESAPSKCVMIALVKVAESIRMRSQGIRF